MGELRNRKTAGKLRLMAAILVGLFALLLAGCGCSDAWSYTLPEKTSDAISYTTVVVDATSMDITSMESTEEELSLITDDPEETSSQIETTTAEEPTPEASSKAPETTGTTTAATTEETREEVVYRFRNKNLKMQHYEKHGIEMGFDSADEYEAAASAVVNNPEALHKIEKEDGDDVYYVEETNEFVVVSTDGYIRTYFLPSSGKRYYDRQ